MSVNKIISTISTGTAVVSAVIAAVLLVHELVSGGNPYNTVHNLEGWVSGVGFHLALITLATAAVPALLCRHEK
jgi:hypothetical protein